MFVACSSFYEFYLQYKEEKIEWKLRTDSVYEKKI